MMTPAEFGLTKAAYSVNETLTLLSIGRTSLYRLIEIGELKPTKFGKRTLFCNVDLANLLNRWRDAPGRSNSDGRVF